MKWKLRNAPRDISLYEALRDLELPTCFATGLWFRGLKDPESVRDFFYPSADHIVHPADFGESMVVAVRRLRQAFEQKEHIVVFGDYDVDGTCGTALVQEVLTKLSSHYGFSSEVMLSDRFTEGYGLNPNNMNRLLDLRPNLVITVDCGISSAAEIGYLRSRDVDVIVTDHHGLKGEFPNEAVAVVHPAFSTAKMPSLSGCGVAWQLMRGLWSSNGKDAPAWLQNDALDLVALGAVCDIMPLNEGYNRIVVRDGMKLIENGKRTVFKVMARSLKWKKVSTYTLGFVIGPRLNAAGRMNRDNGAAPVVECLLAQEESRCEQILADLERFNSERRQRQEEALQFGIAFVENNRIHKRLALVLGEFHEGVAGIVASKLAERFYQPAFVLAKSEEDPSGLVLKGSARSIPGVDLFKVIEKKQHYLSHWGGHAMAAGLTLPADQVEAFFNAVDVELEKVPDSVWERVRWIDGRLQNEDLTPEFFRALEELEPHGEGNPPFIWLIEGVTEGRVIDRPGSPKSGLLLIGETKVPFVMWEQAEKCSLGDRQAFVGFWSFNDFHKKLQFQIIDVLSDHELGEV